MKTVKIILIFTLISFTAGSIYPQYSSPLKFKYENSVLKDSAKNTQKLSYKSPAIAGCLSFFVPGASLGQIYNENYEKFALHFGISAAILAFAIVGSQTGLYDPYLGGDPGGGTGGTGKKDKRGWIFVVCILAYTGNWLWSTIDAIHSATMNNREMEQKRARLKDRTRKSVNYNFGFGIDRNNRINFKTVLNF